MNASRIIKFARLSLGGAILGVAVAGLIGRRIGIDDKTITDAAGALTGAGAVVAVKLAHLI
jgi:uncharacterized protein YcfJ